jgi:hypothetical protein
LGVHFYGKVKKNASSIKNGRATPKRYRTTLLNICLSTASSIVAPPSCPFVAPACCCLLHCLCRWHLCCASLIWLIVVFTPPSCLLLPLSPKRAFVTVRPIVNVSCPKPHSSCPPSRPFIVPAGCCLTNCLCCWHICRCCACQCPHLTGIISIVVLASLPLLPPTLPSSIAAIKPIFAMHPSFGCFLCLLHMITILVRQMTRSGVAWPKTKMPTTEVPWRKTTPRIPVAARLKKTMPPIAMVVQPKMTPRIAMAVQQITTPRNVIAVQ